MLPQSGLSKAEIFKRLGEFANLDANPYSGKLFTIAFEPGNEELREVAHRAFEMFMDKNILDFTEFKSAMKMEKEVVDIAKRLMHADGEVVGTYTFGGTESVFLAVKAARDNFIIRKGFQMPEIVMPIHAHPCYEKAAEYMGLKVVRVPVNPETLEGDPDAINEAITENTAMIVASTPNWPFGTIDPVKEFAEIAEDKKIWLHVDACVGGFILPFFEKLGEDIPEFDFRVEGISSMSLDPHKYAYSSIGSSIVLFKKPFYKMLSQYANLRWPGYPIVNPAVLSSRSAGPLAATWAILHYLGEEGYTELARKILSARRKIIDGFSRLGFKLLGKPRSPIVAFTSDEVDLFTLTDVLMKKGWLVLPQISKKDFKIPRSIHLTITPIHDMLADEFLKAVEEAKSEAKAPAEAEVVRGLGMITSLLSTGEDTEALRLLMTRVEQYIELYGNELIKAFGLEKGLPDEMAMIYELFDAIPPEITELLVNYLVIELYRRGF